MEECSIDSAGSLSEVCQDVLGQALGVEDTGSGAVVVDSAVLLAASRNLLTELRRIEVPSFQEYALALQDAIESSYDSIVAWLSLFILFLDPMWRFVAVFAKAIWPHVVYMTSSAIGFQASLPVTTLLAEAAAVTLTILLVLLRRFIARRRYVARAQRSIRLFRARVNGRYLTFTTAVERNFRLSARAFPHVLYWVATALLAWLAPEFTDTLREKLWLWMTVTWPALYALYLVLCIRGQESNSDGGRIGGGAGNRRASEVAANAAILPPSAGTPNSPAGTSGAPRRAVVTPRDVDRVLMYWVVFTIATCCGVLAQYVPFAASMISSFTPPFVRTAAFFVVVWMHLPGPGSGLQVVYAVLEPLVHTYVKDLRTPEELSDGALGHLRRIVVFLGIVTSERAQVIADNVVDSWMLLPTPIFLFTPSFLTNLGCLYAGLVVPALNSIKTLGRRSQTNILRESASAANPAAGARVRWLTYWVGFGGWWHVSWFLRGLLKVLPLSRHLELLLLLWLQVPVFHGARRVLDIGEGFLTTWTSVAPSVNGSSGR